MKGTVGVAMGCEVLDEEVEGDDSGFFQAVHSFADFQVDETIGGDVDVVMGIIPNFLGNAPRSDAHILEIRHWGAEVVIFDVEAKVASAVFCVGNGAVDVDLGIQHGDGGGAGIAGVV